MKFQGSMVRSLLVGDLGALLLGRTIVGERVVLFAIRLGSRGP